MQPLVTAPLDDLFLDTYYFYVPLRLVWEHAKEFFGENTESAWYPRTEYTVPQLNSGDGFEIGSIADYFGLPVGVKNISVSALPFRAYSLIMNEWFRDQNLMDPLETPVSDAQQTYTKVSAAYNPQQYANGGKPFIACKAHDYFTSSLPQPQRGTDIAIELGNSSSKVFTGARHDNNGSFTSLTYSAHNNASINQGVTGVLVPGVNAASLGSLSNSMYVMTPGSTKQAPQGFVQSNLTFTDSNTRNISIYPDNLYADVSVDPITINQLRQAIALQQLYEIDARSGSRYGELIHAHFGVTSPDARLQRPEYLGGNRIPINVNQVVQNSASTDDSPQGNIAGMSITSDSHGDFMRSFTEHGFIIGVCVARYTHTYQQGIERMWSRKSRFDYYWPGLANIGEMAVLNKEIYATGTPADDEVFGYQEAWGDYRFKKSYVTSEMRSNHDKTLDSWHFADDYDSQPYLSADWIREDKSNVDRALAVTSSVSNQLFADFYIQNVATRPMPLYSVPGLERI